MRYVQARNGVFERHVHDVEPTQWDENNYCFARRLDPDRAAMLGVHKLKIVTPPYFDPAVEKRVEKDAILVDGVWTQVYAVEPLTDEEVEAAREEQARRVRAERNRLLEQSDWTQVSDAPVDQAAWAVYRQAFRDITDHANFPYLQEADWPVKP
jgi:hypothetical protein